MKSRTPSLFAAAKATLLSGALVLTAALNSASAANLDFSGGGGTPLSFTLLSDVTYTLTGVPVGGNPPFFVFEDVGNIFPFTFPPVAGSITYSINGGAALSLTTANTGFTGGVTIASDIYFYGPDIPTLSIGDVLTLSAGTLVTTGNFDGPAPADGEYQTFIANGSGINIGTGTSTSSSVPDTGTTLTLLAASLVGLVALRRRAA